MTIRITLIICMVLITLGDILYFVDPFSDDENEQVSDQPNKPPSSSEDKDELEQGTSLESIFALAEQGKVLDSDIVVGEATIDDDRKSTRLNSSHVAISYAVFCLKKK